MQASQWLKIDTRFVPPTSLRGNRHRSEPLSSLRLARTCLQNQIPHILPAVQMHLTMIVEAQTEDHFKITSTWFA